MTLHHYWIAFHLLGVSSILLYPFHLLLCCADLVRPWSLNDRLSAFDSFLLDDVFSRRVIVIVVGMFEGFLRIELPVRNAVVLGPGVSTFAMVLRWLLIRVKCSRAINQLFRPTVHVC